MSRQTNVSNRHTIGYVRSSFENGKGSMEITESSEMEMEPGQKLQKIGPRYQPMKDGRMLQPREAPHLLLEGGINPELTRPRFRRTSILNCRNSLSTQCLRPLNLPYTIQ